MAVFNKNNSNNRYTLRLTVEELSTSVENNSSTVSWQLQLISNTSWYFSSYKIGYSVTLDGTQVAYQAKSGSYSLPAYQTLNLASGTSVIPHNDDGTKELPVAWTISMTAEEYTPGNLSATGSMRLSDIPRASTMTVPAFTAGAAGQMVITRASSSFTHRIDYAFGSAQGSVTAITSSTTVAWTPPKSLLVQIPNAVSGTGTLQLYTYNGDTLIGSKQYTFTLTAGSDIKPACSLQTSDASGLADTFGAYVQGRSQLQAVISGTPSYGSPISAYSLIVDGKTYTEAETTSDPLIQTGSQTVTARVTDSRGRSDETTVQINVLPYAAPIVVLSATRCTSDGTADQEGEYMKIAISAQISSLDSQNSATYTITYKRSSDSAQQQITGVGTSYTSGPIILVAGDTCDITATVDDEITSTSAAAFLPVSFVLLDFHAGGKGMAVGKVATDPDGFECRLPANFTGGLAVNGAALVDIVYPIGSVYISVAPTDPGTLLGGSWQRLKDRFLLGAGDVYAAGETGGSASMQAHTHGTPAITGTTADGEGNHSHSLTASAATTHNRGGAVLESFSTGATNTTRQVTSATSGNDGGHSHTVSIPAGTTDSAGDGDSGNMPPYLAVYMWQRIS